MKKWIMALIAFIGGLGVGLLKDTMCSSQNIYSQLALFSEALKLVKDNYVKEVEDKDIIYGAIKGMTLALDPYSSFLTPDMYKELEVETTGEFGGLGIEITIKDSYLTIVAPIEDTPAYRAGLKSGDRILKINGEPTKDLTLMEAVKRLRGPKGTKVTLTIWREGVPKPFDVTITRDIIKIKSVKDADLGEGYVYIKIKSFQEDTSGELKRAIEKYYKRSPINGLILDLRNNPGGLLSEAIKVSDLFLKKGLIVYTKGRTASSNMEFKADEDGYTDFPMIVLVNRGSASASEIVASSLKDNKRAVLMGEKTFGKGSVQTIYRLSDNSGLRLTTALYYTPSNYQIQDNGLMPDIIFESQKAKEQPEEEEEEPVEEKMQKFDPASDPMVRSALGYLKSWNIWGKNLFMERNKESSAK
jgi:carboxyl-terminal processing protease